MADLPIHLDRARRTPLAAQIYRAIREAIETGRLASGARLPSWRDLAAQLGVSRGTVRVAYGRLIDEQFAIDGSGRHVTDESIAMETIRQTCLEGPGHYLGADQTLRLMQTEYVYPLVGDRTTPKEWVEQGRPGIVDRAIRKTKHILSNHFPAHISTAVDDSIRQRFPVRLSREAMRKTAAAAE
jgi:trimethylamine:corrinoid methyltransferase-like protein